MATDTTTAEPGTSRPAETVNTNPALLRLVRARSVLLLQGPVGSFFDRLTLWLKRQGIQVERVAFQAGDSHDAQAVKPIPYVGTLADWATFFDQTVKKLGTDCVVLFGQVRAYHQIAIQRARALGLGVVVMEEGYVRPGYLTMELEGVNGYSDTLSRYRWDPRANGPTLQLEKAPPESATFGHMARSAMAHYWAMGWGHTQFPHYQHHKTTSVPFYCRYWVKSWLIKQAHRWYDERFVRQLATDQNPYYLVPLQHDGDSQITHHSRFGLNTAFIIEVVRSFAEFAPAGTQLVFKQHPFSRGGKSHSAFIRSLARELDTVDRVVHLVEGHTPTLVKHAKAVVVINSTVGLQALLHRRPMIALGEAIYTGPGLTHQGSLNTFWKDPGRPDEVALSAFLDQIIHLTQVPCNAYGPVTEPLHWTIQER